MYPINLMHRAAETIRHMRHIIEIQNAKLEVFEKCAMMAGSEPPRSGGWVGEPDIAAELQKEANEMASKMMPDKHHHASDEPADVFNAHED